MVIRTLEPRIVLDLGCGTGPETGALADLPGVRVVAIDVDADALSKVPQRANVLRVRADATRLPLAQGAADAAYSFGLVQVLGIGSDARVRHLMEELRRVVRPGGAAVMGTLADFGRTDGPDRSLTGADISKSMRGALVLRELIGLMDLGPPRTPGPPLVHLRHAFNKLATGERAGPEAPRALVVPLSRSSKTGARPGSVAAAGWPGPGCPGRNGSPDTAETSARPSGGRNAPVADSGSWN